MMKKTGGVFTAFLAAALGVSLVNGMAIAGQPQKMPMANDPTMPKGDYRLKSAGVISARCAGYCEEIPTSMWISIVVEDANGRPIPDLMATAQTSNSNPFTIETLTCSFETTATFYYPQTRAYRVAGTLRRPDGGTCAKRDEIFDALAYFVSWDSPAGTPIASDVGTAHLMRNPVSTP